MATAKKFKAIYGVDLNTQDITNGTWTGNIVAPLYGGTGTSNGSITGTSGNLTFTAYAGNNNVALVPTGTGTVTVPSGYESRAGFGATSLTNKAYVDSVAQGLSIKGEVRLATAVGSNINLSSGGLLVVDGVQTVAGDRVLVKNQTNSYENGIYVVASGAWSRSSDANTKEELSAAFVFVQLGNTNDNTGWVCTLNDNTAGTLWNPGDSGGTYSAIVWNQFAGAGTFTAGYGLTLTGNTFSINLAQTADLTTAQTLSSKTLTAPTVDTQYTATTNGNTVSVQSVVRFTIAGSTTETLDTTDATVYKSIAYIIQTTDNTDYSQTQINVAWKSGQSPVITEYGGIDTGSALATFDADLNSGSIRLRVTQSGTRTYKVIKSAFTT